MLEDGPGQVISVEGAGLGGVASDQPFGRLDSHFSSLVCSGMVGGAHPRTCDRKPPSPWR